MASSTMETNSDQPDPAPLDLDLDYPPEVTCILSCVFCRSDLTVTSEQIEKAKLLSCFHSVCQKCVETWQPNEFKACPMCHITNSLSDLIENKLLQELVEVPECEQADMCKMHSDFLVLKYCKECEQAVCKTCIESHAMLRITKDHNMVDLSQMPSASNTSLVHFKCPEHPSCTMSSFCIDCDTFVCRDCIIRNHAKHTFVMEIEAHCQELRKKLHLMRSQLDRNQQRLRASEDLLKQKMNDAFQQQARINQQLDKYCGLTIATVKEKFHGLKKTLSDYIAEDQLKMKRIKSSNEIKSKPLNHVIEVIDVLLNRVSDSNFLYNYRHFRSGLQKLLPADRVLELANCDTRRTYKLENIEPMFQEFANYMAKLGRVISFIEESEGATPVPSGQMAPNPSGQTSSSPPVRCRPTGDLQLPESRGRSQESMPIAPEAPATSSGMISWHRPQQLPAWTAPPMHAVPSSSASQHFTSLSNTMVSNVPAVTSPLPPPASRSRFTVSLVCPDAPQNEARPIGLQPSLYPLDPTLASQATAISSLQQSVPKPSPLQQLQPLPPPQFQQQQQQQLQRRQQEMQNLTLRGLLQPPISQPEQQQAQMTQQSLLYMQSHHIQQDVVFASTSDQYVRAKTVHIPPQNPQAVQAARAAQAQAARLSKSTLSLLQNNQISVFPVPGQQPQQQLPHQQQQQASPFPPLYGPFNYLPGGTHNPYN